MDMLGQKIALTANGEEEDENPYKDAKVTITEDTKTIAGYKCKKAIIEPKDSKDGKLELYFTKELGSNARNASGPFKQIEGAVLEYGIKQQGMDMKFSASTVSKEKVPDTKFNIPEGYTFMSRKDFMKSMGGGK
jgi:GLPGLI family protein